MTTAERVKGRRKALGYSVADLARLTDKHVATVYRWEKGDIDDWPVDTLVAIAQALKTTPAYLLGQLEDQVKLYDDQRRDELFDKYGALMSDIDALPEDQRKEIEDFIRFKMGQYEE